MKINNWKQYVIILIINVLIGFLLTVNCEGERCMILIPVLFYVSVVIISHVPYLFLKPFNKIQRDKILAFIFPSFIMLLVIILTIKMGSNIPLSSHNLIWIGASILPNTILQVLFYISNKRQPNEIELD